MFEPLTLPLTAFQATETTHVADKRELGNQENALRLRKANSVMNAISHWNVSDTVKTID